MVASLITYFERERDFGGPLLPLTSVRARVAEALQLSLGSVNRISADVHAGNALCSPNKTHSRSKPVTELDISTETAIRDTIYEMYKQKQHITLKTLLSKLKDKQICNGSEASLRRILKKLGFKWLKDNPRRGLLELSHIAFKCVDFLRSYLDNKNDAIYQFVFLDETWIFQDGTISRSWQNEDVRSVKSTKTNGKRYIILHAGNENGFIDGAELVFSSSSQSGDYHGEMNTENFLYWFEHQLLINLKQPSIIIMDNAPYHSAVENKTPSTTWKKAAIQNWLTENKIDFDPQLLKPQLLQKVSQNKPPKSYVADKLALTMEHKMLRLPPYHCMFNPIEHVWGIAKTYYNRHVGRDGRSTENCIALWRESLCNVTPRMWADCVKHTEKEILKWWDKEKHLDAADVTPLIINLQDSSEESESESYE